jgi:pantoate--beta-alanine ligase
MPLKIVVLPTVREKDGLAMSSRNAYLSSEERKNSLVLYRSLRLAGDMVKRGVTDSRKIESAMRKIIRGKTSDVDYINVVDPEDLSPVLRISPGSGALIALAVRIGKTRLIDNFIVEKERRSR